MSKNKKFQKSCLNILQDYLQSECSIELTAEEQEYYQALYALIGISRKYGKDNAISFLMHPPFSVERGIARRMYAEAVNLFYLNEEIENDALRNMLFDDLRKAALVVLQNAKSSDDMKVYGDLLVQASRIKNLDKPDKEVPFIEENKTIKVYSLDAAAVGLPTANRNEIAQQIDAIENLSVAEKTRLKRDAQVTDIDIEDILDEQEKKTEGYK